MTVMGPTADWQLLSFTVVKDAVRLTVPTRDMRMAAGVLTFSLPSATMRLHGYRLIIRVLTILLIAIKCCD